MPSWDMPSFDVYNLTPRPIQARSMACRVGTAHDDLEIFGAAAIETMKGRCRGRDCADIASPI